jgi:hypothetical protein
VRSGARSSDACAVRRLQARVHWPVGCAGQSLRGSWHGRRWLGDCGAIGSSGLNVDPGCLAGSDVGFSGCRLGLCCRLGHQLDCPRGFPRQRLGRNLRRRLRLERQGVRLLSDAIAVGLGRPAGQRLCGSPTRLSRERRNGSGSAAGGARKQWMARHVARSGVCVRAPAIRLPAKRGLRCTRSGRGLPGEAAIRPLLIAGAFNHGPVSLRPVSLRPVSLRPVSLRPVFRQTVLSDCLPFAPRTGPLKKGAPTASLRSIGTHTLHMVATWASANG